MAFLLGFRPDGVSGVSSRSGAQWPGRETAAVFFTEHSTESKKTIWPRHLRLLVSRCTDRRRYRIPAARRGSGRRRRNGMSITYSGKTQTILHPIRVSFCALSTRVLAEMPNARPASAERKRERRRRRIRMHSICLTLDRNHWMAHATFL